MDVHTSDNTALVGLAPEPHLVAPGALQVLTPDKAERVAGGILPIGCFGAVSTITNLVMKYF